LKVNIKRVRKEKERLKMIQKLEAMEEEMKREIVDEALRKLVGGTGIHG